MNWKDPLFVAQLLALLFFTVLFLQSGIDKLVDFKGNRDYFNDHFSSTWLGKMVPLLLPMITLIEFAAGLGCAFGAVSLFLPGFDFAPTLGLAIAGLALVSLFAGQRINKDYVGAHVIATYFGVLLFALFLTYYRI